MLLLWTSNADVQFINAGQDSTFNHQILREDENYVGRTIIFKDDSAEKCETISHTIYHS